MALTTTMLSYVDEYREEDGREDGVQVVVAFALRGFYSRSGTQKAALVAPVGQGHHADRVRVPIEEPTVATRLRKNEARPPSKSAPS